MTAIGNPLIAPTPTGIRILLMTVTARAPLPLGAVAARVLLMAALGRGRLFTARPKPIPVTPVVAPEAGTALLAGDVALVAFTTEGTQNDQFAFVLLKAVSAGTQVNLSDENWTGSGFGTSDGGHDHLDRRPFLRGGHSWCRPYPTSDGSKSSTHACAVNIYSAGVTYSNVTGPGNQAGTYAFDLESPIQVVTVDNTGNGLTGWSGGDQFLFFQGPAVVGESGAGVTFLGAMTYNQPWLTGTPTPSLATGAYSYLPPGLTDGSTAMAVTDPVGNGGYYDLAQGAAGTEAVLEALLNNQANWVLSMPGVDLPPARLLSMGLSDRIRHKMGIIKNLTKVLWRPSAGAWLE